MQSHAAIARGLTEERPYTKSSPLSLEAVELLAPRAGELLLRIEAVGVCHSDLSVINGSRIRPLPMALGHEAAGIVASVGEGVDDIEVGDHVVLSFVPSCGTCDECQNDRPALCIPAAKVNGTGDLLHGPAVIRDGDGCKVHHHLGVSGFAKHAVVARESVVRIPKDVPMETAALFGCAILTGVGAVINTANVRAGQSIAVFGLGGVGLASVMGGQLVGARTIIAVDPMEEKRNVALELGATAVFHPDEAVEGISKLTEGGVDFAFEAVGVSSVMEVAFQVTNRGGMAVSMGLPHPTQKVTFPALAFAGLGKTFTGSYMGSSVPQRDIPRYIEAWRDGRLPVEKLRTATLPLSEINHAFEELAAGRAIRQILLPHA
jgi:Zn-dependent alcohol dehydrogenase